MMLGLLIVFGCLAMGGYAYLQQPKFGKTPSSSSERIKQSLHYKNGEFQNLVPIPPMLSGGGRFVRLLTYVFTSKEQQIPPGPVPSIKSDLLALDRDEDIVIWLGHSSYFAQIGGRRILIDPVFSSHASPVSFANKAFAGTSVYTAEDMPETDYLLISHDHWDHLDQPTVTALKPKIRNVICGLGVGAHFEHWGYASESIHEGDWFTALELEDGFTIHVLPARHYSGRSLTRNKTLWAAFALITPQGRIFFSGDSGYGPHFEEIGKVFKGFDMAILDCGQYDNNWRHVHMMPEDAAKAAEDLHARTVMPAHSGRFAIAYHSWDDPFRRLSDASRGKIYRLLTPMIGELVDLNDGQQSFSRWWESMAR
jgi:L-ascorbate metabolism protein UlaG (beta-lactamase superfamily)